MASSKKLLLQIYDTQDLLFLALFFISFCYYVNLVWKIRYLLIKSWNHPGPFNFPVIGSLGPFICKRKYVLDRFTQLQEKYPSGAKMWFGYTLLYFLHEPEHIKKILGNGKLVTKDKTFYDNFTYDNMEGLLTSPPAKWKKYRKIIVPSFNQQILNSSVEVFARKSLVLNEILAENCGRELDIQNILARCILDTACVPLKRMPFLDHIMESGQFSEEQLTAEIGTFLIAATDTGSTALSFVFTVLGMFPDIQQKVYEEVTQILGNDRSPEFTDLPEMLYTERVIKETLRLFPVAPIFVRAVTEDVDMGEFVIPKGATAFFGLMFIHRNPKYWPDPLKFDPDRFLPEEVAKRHPCTYIPFSFGPRNCIGKTYGMMNIKVLLATVIRKYVFHSGYRRVEDIKVKFDFSLNFQDGAKVSMTPRQ